MGSAPRFPISALTLVEKHIPYTVYSIPNFPQKQNPNLRKTAPNKPRFHLPHILRILRSGNFCVVTPLALPKNKLHENKLRFVTAPLCFCSSVVFFCARRSFWNDAWIWQAFLSLGGNVGGAVSLVGCRYYQGL